MTLLFIVFLPSAVMLHLFINILKLFLDNIFVAGLLHSCVVLYLMFLFGWDSKNSDISIHLCLIDFTATYGVRTSKSNFLKILQRTSPLQFFLYTRHSKKLLKLLYIQILPLIIFLLHLSWHFQESCLTVDSSVFRTFLAR